MRLTRRLPPREPLDVVACVRPRCPACRSPDLRAYRTDRLDDARGVIERHTVCRVCGKRFRLALQ